MLQLPKSTEYNKRIPNNKFYDKLKMSTSLRETFKEQIQVIYWKNKITSNQGKKVTELQVIKIILNQPYIDEAILKALDQKIPYHILFILCYKDQVKAYIARKEASSSNYFEVNTYYHTDWVTEETLELKLEGSNMDTIYDNFIVQIAEKQNEAQKETLEYLLEKETQEEPKQEVSKIDTLEKPNQEVIEIDTLEDINKEVVEVHTQEEIDVINKAIRSKLIEELLAKQDRKREIEAEITIIQSDMKKEKQFNKRTLFNWRLKALKKESMMVGTQINNLNKQIDELEK